MGILGSLINKGLGAMGVPFKIGGGGMGGGIAGGGGLPIQSNVVPIGTNPLLQRHQMEQSQQQQRNQIMNTVAPMIQAQQQQNQNQQGQLLSTLMPMLQRPQQPLTPQQEIQNVFRKRYPEQQPFQ